jgi:hypothetical protein
MPLSPSPPWLYLLNALEKDWRMAEILKDHDPDPGLEKQLRIKGLWPDYLVSLRTQSSAPGIESNKSR